MTPRSRMCSSPNIRGHSNRPGERSSPGTHIDRFPQDRSAVKSRLPEFVAVDRLAGVGQAELGAVQAVEVRRGDADQQGGIGAEADLEQRRSEERRVGK